MATEINPAEESDSAPPQDNQAEEREAYIADPNEPLPAQTEPSGDLSPVVVIRRTTLNYIVIAAVFLFVGIFIGAFSAYRVERDHHSWISDAISEAISQQDFAGMVAAAKPASLDNPDSQFDVTTTSDHALGAEDAPIVMIEFGDFNCGFCARFQRDTFPQLIANYGDKIRFVYRDYPILAQSSLTAALAARCAADQGKFWEYHDLLYQNQGTFNQSGGFAALAEQLDLDVDTFNTCVDDQSFLSGIIADSQEGQKLGIRGTPAFFINGHPVSGAQPYEVFAGMIDQQLAALNGDAEQSVAG